MITIVCRSFTHNSSTFGEDGYVWLYYKKMQLDVEESTPASDLLILPQNCNWQLPSYYYLQHVDNSLPF